MRFILAAGLLLLSACRQQPDASANNLAEPAGDLAASAEPASSGGLTFFQAGGRNRMCLGEGRAGFIVYAASGDANCSVRGSVQRNGPTLSIAPEGDAACRIEAREDGTALRLDPVTPACAYYCGPGASYAGTSFNAMPGPVPVTDLAGDPLC